MWRGQVYSERLYIWYVPEVISPKFCHMSRSLPLVRFVRFRIRSMSRVAVLCHSRSIHRYTMQKGGYSVCSVSRVVSPASIRSVALGKATCVSNKVHASGMLYVPVLEGRGFSRFNHPIWLRILITLAFQCGQRRPKLVPHNPISTCHCAHVSWHIPLLQRKDPPPL